MCPGACPPEEESLRSPLEDSKMPFSSHRRASSEQQSPPSSRPQRPGLGRAENRGISEEPYGQYPESPFSPLAADMVFPIRSFVSVEPTPTPMSQFGGGVGDGFPGMVLPGENSAISEQLSGTRRFSASGVLSTDQISDSSNANTPTKSRRSMENSQTIAHGSMGQKSEVDEMRKRSESVSGNGRHPDGNQQTKPPKTSSEAKTEENRGQHRESTLKSIAESTSSGEAGGLVTARFKHVETEGGHAVIIGRDGDTLQRCEDEPIHIPGAIQGFGLLIALQEETDGKFKVRVVSENSKRIVGYTPGDLFALDSFCDILSEEQADNLLDHVDFIRDEDADTAVNGPEVFTIAIRTPSRKTQKLWCAIHINENNSGTIICEFELEDDIKNPLVHPEQATPEPPEDTLNSNPTAEEYAESTVNKSRPLRVLRSARKRKGEAATMEVFNIMSQVQEQLATAPTLDAFLKVLVGVVKELTGFHRVMVYQFDQVWNGRVVTEIVDPRATKDLYKGLNFPASDIPKQARDLYKINKVRLLYDRDQETARLVCRTIEDLEKPLDLTHAYLRAMSPIHVKYLANMAVRSSMSISINAFAELWGLIACHSYGSKGMRVSFPIRKMCRLVGDAASRNIERLSYASRLQARKLINTVPTETNPSGYIIASSDDLLALFDADYGILSIRDETKILGKLDQTQEALALLEYLRLRKLTSVMTSHDVRLNFPDLRYPPGFSVIAGLLLVPLSVNGNDFIVFFRRGQLREVKWAGNPHEKFIKEGTSGYLEPRKSFKTWSETVTGKCREWTEEQTETAAVLCLVYGKFIEVWRQKEAALQNSQLTKILLANSAHEVRTPLNAIINYLEIALEGTLDQDTRENLAKSHSASKSLIYVINDLLDLTKMEEGRDLIKDEVFDFLGTVREATDMFTGDAKRKQIDYEVIENPGVPRYVIGDQRRVRQVISNVTANAFQHTTIGAVKVELTLAGNNDGHVEIDIAVQDTGIGMSSKKLDALFRDLEQVSSENDEGPQEKLAPHSKHLSPGKHNKKPLGLGLAIVARIIRNMDGQLRLKSEEGKGSRFVIQLGFDLPPDEKRPSSLESAISAGTSPPTDQPRTPPITEGEMLLVNKSSQKGSSSSVNISLGRQSNESITSVKSTSLNTFESGSSARSDVDRLIGAIQEPQVIGKSQSITAESRKSRAASWGESISDSPTRWSSASPTSLHHAVAPIAGIFESRSSTLGTTGQAAVVDSKTPIRPVRVPQEDSQASPVSELPPKTAPRFLLDASENSIKKTEPLTADNLHVLVAEDDPINSKIISKRLEKTGHTVFLTVNGEECSSAYGEKVAFYDVVLMDMQVGSHPVMEPLLTNITRCQSLTG